MALLQDWFHKKTNPGDSARTRTDLPAAHPETEATARRQRRMERRELLYAVVREVMVRAGVLSADYNFKVLSLEPQGRHYIVMIDVAADRALPTPRLADIEQQLIEEVKRRHDLRVTAIYWRLATHLKGVARDARPGLRHAPPAPRFEPIGADEVAALRHALAAGMNPTQGAGFEDTELMVGAKHYPALSQTQYGDLK